MLVSACLLGEQVRYDGAHKRDAWLSGWLGSEVDWVRVCPEVELGLGVPREKIRLVQLDQEVGLFGESTGRSLGAPMQRLATERAEQLRSEQLCGAILKSRSPSCGLGDANIWKDEDIAGVGDGVFAVTLREKLPWLPVVSDAGLQDLREREDFLVRVFLYARLWSLASEPDTVCRLDRLETERLLVQFLAPDQYDLLLVSMEKGQFDPDLLAGCSLPGSGCQRQQMSSLCRELGTEEASQLGQQILNQGIGQQGWVRWAERLGRVARLAGSPLANQTYLRPLPFKAELLATG